MAYKIVKITRAQAAEHLGYCRKGLRAWCENNGFSWEQFCSEGLDLEAVQKTGDARALALIEAISK